MPGETCVVCGNNRRKEPKLSYHRIPKHPDKRRQWLTEFKLSNDELKPHSRVCSRHFRDGNPQNGPLISLGNRFASPLGKDVTRNKRAQQRRLSKEYREVMHRSLATAPIHVGTINIYKW